MLNKTILKQAEEVVRLYHQYSRTIALIESCTGGLVSSAITNIEGASNILNYGVVSYTNQAKQKLLGISKEFLNNHGAVSRKTAEAMAAPEIKIDSDVILSITGVAGPDKEEGKPVGLVYIGINNAATDDIWSHECNFEGNRDNIRLQATQKALELLKI